MFALMIIRVYELKPISVRIGECQAIFRSIVHYELQSFCCQAWAAVATMMVGGAAVLVALA